MISHISSSGTISNTIMAFDDVKFSLGITNLSTFRNTGKFTFEHGGLYIISASVLSITDNAYYFISLNGNDILRTVHTSANIAVKKALLVQWLLPRSYIKMIKSVCMLWEPGMFMVALIWRQCSQYIFFK